jgi:seryl-tRNA synthetase
MHDLGFVREHMDLIEKMAGDHGITLDLDPFKELDAERRKIITSTERMKAERNKANETIAQLKRPSPGSTEGPGDMLPAMFAKLKEASDEIKRTTSVSPSLTSGCGLFC